MDIQSLIYSGVVVSATGTLVYQLRSLPISIYKRIQRCYVYSVKIYQYDELFDVLEAWLFKHHNKTYRDVEATIGNNEAPSSEGNKKVLTYKQEDNMFVMGYAGKRLFITKGKEKIDKAGSAKELYFRHFTIRGWRCREEVDKLLGEALEEWTNQRNSSSIRIYTNTQYGEWFFGSDNSVKSFDNIILPPETKAFIMADLEEFQESRAWYAERSIPYKRSYCLHGPPGNGKTSLAQAIAHKLKRDLFVLNIASIENDSNLTRAMTGLGQNSVLVIEDIDRVFNQRESLEARISFSALLNALDGALYREGLFTIITTNHIDSLDPALIRPGRMDEKLLIDNPTGSLAAQYISLFYGQQCSGLSLSGVSMSGVQEVCMRNKHSMDEAICSLKTKSPA